MQMYLQCNIWANKFIIAGCILGQGGLKRLNMAFGDVEEAQDKFYSFSCLRRGDQKSDSNFLVPAYNFIF